MEGVERLTGRGRGALFNWILELSMEKKPSGSDLAKLM